MFKYVRISKIKYHYTSYNIDTYPQTLFSRTIGTRLTAANRCCTACVSGKLRDQADCSGMKREIANLYRTKDDCCLGRIALERTLQLGCLDYDYRLIAGRDGEWY